MKKALLLITASLCPLYAVFAQNNKPLIDSKEAIKAGVELHDAGKYKEALKEYDKVSPSDTNYVQALYEKALSCSADSQFTKGIKYCEEALALPIDRTRCPELLTELGSLLDDDKQTERALHIYDSGIALYPHYTLLRVNKATTLLRLEKYREAAEILKQALLIDPYSSSAHYKLGVCALNMGNPVAAYLSFTTNMLIAPQGSFYKNSIGLMSEIAKNSDNVVEWVSKRKEEPGESFRLIEQIVASKIALDKNYKAVIKLDDPISRQLQVILEKLSYDEQDKDFWMQYYVPYYASVFQNKKFEYLVNHIFSAVEIKSIKEFNQKNKKELSAFTDEAVIYFNAIRASQILPWKKREAETSLYYFEKGSLVGKGATANKGELLTGPWIFHFFAGNKKATGNFSAQGEKEGPWKYYFFNGQLKGEEIYKAGKQEGAETDYYESGVVSARLNYKNGEMDGEGRFYYPEGALKKIENYRNGKLQGARTIYYTSGIIKAIENYQEDKLNGGYKLYHPNGQLSEEGNYVNGVLNGPYKSWSSSGILSIEAQYEQDKIVGVVKRYHDNGKLKSTENFSNGKLEGDYTEYWNTGQLFTKYVNKKGKTSGEVNYYDRDGKVYSTYTFNDDRLRKAVYFDKTGKEISKSELNDGRLELNIYSPEGFKRTTTIYSKKSVAEGPQISYYPSGKTSEKYIYKEGELQGPASTWHINGQQSNDLSYEAGKKQGYYTHYNLYGAKKQEGWYVEDLSQGPWTFYDDYGTMTSVTNYLNDEYDGYKTDYWQNGNIESVSKYDMGRLLEMIQYDTLGKEINRVVLTNGNGKFSWLHLNGKVTAEVTYKEGNMHGVQNFYYYDGSLQTKQYYKNGLRDSIYRGYYFGGKIQTEGQYKAGEKTGTWKSYNNEGVLTTVEEYKFGELNGKKIYYYENGKPESEMEFVDGERDGITKKYHKDGSLLYQLTHRDGKIISYSYLDKTGKLVPEILVPGGNGQVKTYYANGTVSALWAYADYEVHGEDNTWHPNGKPWMVSTEFYGNTEKDLKYFYPEGTVMSQYVYLRDEPHGVFKDFYVNGKVKTEGNYYKGDLHGSYKKYDELGKLLETRVYYYGQLISVKK